MHARFEPPAVAAPASRDQALEGLRGLAALAVLYAHLTFPGHLLDPRYTPPKFLSWIEVAVMAVMLFFILSGYVIGLTNQRAATRENVRVYLGRRALRLLPIYVAAVSIGWLVLPGPSLGALVGNYFFLQNEAAGSPFHVALIRGNVNLWSLHYEVFYYLAFVALWWLRPPVVPILVGLLVAATLGVVWNGMSIWLAWLACGFVFWLAGLLIAWRLPADERGEGSPWPSALLVCIGTWRLHALATVVARMGGHVVWVPGALLTYLDSLPALLWLFLLVSRRRGRAQQRLEMLAWLWPAAYLGWRFAWHRSFLWTDEIVFTAALLLLAALLRGWHPSLEFWRRLAPIGTISYGIYAFGAPAQIFVRSLLPQFSGRWWTYGARAGLMLTLALGLAWFFERRLQRWFLLHHAAQPRETPRPV